MRPEEARKFLFIDTDIGIDDAVAVAWLLAQPDVQIVGFSTVFGNTSVEYAAANLLTLLDAAGRRLPVTIGAEAPLVHEPFSIGIMVHGPDGFWGSQVPHNLRDLPRDAPAAIAAAARSTPGLTILALGPLTNIAQAIQRYPEALAGVRLVALGGARHRGNITPVAEFNIFADPHALEIVLASEMQVDIVMSEAFDQLTVDQVEFLDQLNTADGAVGHLLARILKPYFQGAVQNGRTPHIPDAVAAIYAVRPELGEATSALVRVVTDQGYARGQTIVADTFSQRVMLIASPREVSDMALRFLEPDFNMAKELGSILAREPDNARVVLHVDAVAMLRLLEQSLIGVPMRERAVGLRAQPYRKPV